jgi:two-component system NtrC family sensor kinase
MKRKIISALLGAVAVSVLAILVMQSRSVPVSGHLTHFTALTTLERAQDDFDTLLVSLQDAWTETSAPGEGARSLAARIAAGPATLKQNLFAFGGGTSQETRVHNALEGFDRTVFDANLLIQEVLVEQAQYAAAVGFIKDRGSRLVEELRDIRLNRAAEDTFALVIGTLDFAKADATVKEFELQRLLVTLGRDQRVDANMPEEIKQLRDSIALVLETKAPLGSKLEQLRGTPVILAAQALASAEEDLYAATLASTDEAKTLLSVYAILLLLAAGFIALRLNQSYQDLNYANAELEEMNSSLEVRVVERTQELSNTLSELKESQVQLVQAEKMSSLGQLVAGISHEINTPLLYLANNAVLLQERLEILREFVAKAVAAFSIRPEDYPDRSEYQSKFVGSLKTLKQQLTEDEIPDAVVEAESLVSDSIEGLDDLTTMAQSLKDFSRLDRSPVDSFNVNDGIEKTLVIAKNALKHKVNIHKHFGEVPEIQCSPSKINQVFLNIITNASQAIEETGEVVIKTGLHDDDHVAVTISDTGCGITEENLSKIRDPFFTTKEVGSGTGLGLSIVDEIIRGHNGQLLIESEIGKGSCFTIVLPIKQTEQHVESTDELENDAMLESDDLAEAV